MDQSPLLTLRRKEGSRSQADSKAKQSSNLSGWHFSGGKKNPVHFSELLVQSSFKLSKGFCPCHEFPSSNLTILSSINILNTFSHACKSAWINKSVSHCCCVEIPPEMNFWRLLVCFPELWEFHLPSGKCLMKGGEFRKPFSFRPTHSLTVPPSDHLSEWWFHREKRGMGREEGRKKGRSYLLYS